jgi:hypothetical protein
MWMVKIAHRPFYLRQELWYPLHNWLFGTQSPLTSLILQVNIEAETVSHWRWKLRIYCLYDNWRGKKRSRWRKSYGSNISPTIKRTWIVMELNPGPCSGIKYKRYRSVRGSLFLECLTDTFPLTFKLRWSSYKSCLICCFVFLINCTHTARMWNTLRELWALMTACHYAELCCNRHMYKPTY